MLCISAPDYTTLNIPENRPSFFPGNVLNYRGGTRRDSAISFDIQTTADSDDTEPPETFFLNVSPVRTAIVLTPRVPITICGGSHVVCNTSLLFSTSFLQLVVTLWRTLKMVRWQSPDLVQEMWHAMNAILAMSWLEWRSGPVMVQRGMMNHQFAEV